MQLLATPNWSFGREGSLLRQFREILAHPMVMVHYCEADLDQNRTVTAFSGESDVVTDMVFRLAMVAFDVIDLTKHVGTHPRIGALDTCPFMVLGEDGQASVLTAMAAAENLASQLAGTFELPVFLSDRSDRGRHEAELELLRRGGFGGMTDLPLHPDFGPAKVHPRLGVTELGVRDLYLSVNLALATEDLNIGKVMARQIRQMRTEGDPRMLGVRALALPLASRHQVQLSLQLTLPDLTSVDPILEWASERLAAVGVLIADTELVGVIRNQDLLGASRLEIRPSQIIGPW